WTGMMVSPLEALKELYWWIKKIAENKKQQIQDPIPQATVVTDTSPQGWGATLELDSGEVLVAHGALLSHQIHLTSNRKELQAIHLGIIAFAKVCKELQVTNLLIRSDNSTAVFDLRRLNKNNMEHPTKSRSIRIIDNETTTALNNSQYKRLTSPMDRRVLKHQDQRDPINTPSNSNYVKSNFISQQRSNFSNSYSTMVTGPSIVYKLNESIKQVPYPWTVMSMPNQGTKHGKPKKLFTTWKDSSIPHGPEVEKGRIFLTQILDRIGLSRGVQQLLINGQGFETQRHYLYSMRILAEFSYEHGLCIDQLLSISPGFYFQK
ncbi:MAG: hypothetical protein EZS28_034288, partial [Streblomastix strix]